MGGVLPLVNSSVTHLLQTKTQQSYVKANVPRSAVTTAVRPICTFQRLVPVGEVSPIQTDKLQLNCTTIQTKTVGMCSKPQRRFPPLF